MSAGFDSFDNSGMDAFIHSGFDARGGESLPSGNYLICFNPNTGEVRWLFFLGSTFSPVAVDAAGNCYIRGDSKLKRMSLAGVVEYDIAAPGGGIGSTAFQGAKDGLWVFDGVAATPILSNGTFGPFSTTSSRYYLDEAGDIYEYYPVQQLVQLRRCRVDGQQASRDDVGNAVQNDQLSQSTSITNSSLPGTGIHSFFGKLSRTNGDRTLWANAEIRELSSSSYITVESENIFWNGFSRKRFDGDTKKTDLSSRTYTVNGNPQGVRRVLTGAGGNIFVELNIFVYLRINSDGDPLWTAALSGTRSSIAASPLSFTGVAAGFVETNGSSYGKSTTGKFCRNDGAGVVDRVYNLNSPQALVDLRAGHLYATIQLQAGEVVPAFI